MERFEEKQLTKTYDLRLMGKLLKYSRKYIVLLLISVLLLATAIFADLLRPMLIGNIVDNFLGPKTIYLEESPHGSVQIGEKTYDLSREETESSIVDNTFFRGGEKSSLSEEEVSSLRDARYKGVLKITLFLLILVVLSFFSKAIQQLLLSFVGQKVVYSIRSDLFQKLESLSLRFFEGNPVGRLVTRVTNDLNNISELYTNVIVTSLSDFAIVFGSMGMMLAMDVRLTLVTLAPMPVLLVAMVIFRREIRKAYRLVRTRLARINATLSENISGMKTIQIFNQESKFTEEFSKINEEYVKASKRESAIYAVFRPFMTLIQFGSMILLLVYGGNLALKGELEVGVIVAFSIYIIQLYNPIMELAEKFNIFQSAMASIERVFLLFEIQDEIVNAPTVPNLPLEGHVVFENVSFSYNEGEPVLKNVSFEALPGETVAFVGATGSGKSTMMSLLTRLYDVKEGRILIDGKDLRDYDKHHIRKSIAPVLQDVFLFAGDIEGNIKLLNEDISREEVIEAATLVNAWPFISKYSEGLSHPVTEGGSTLSQGERQLLSFARALVVDPDILILDEATSSIDTETELLLQDAIDKVIGNRTTFIVAHRLSTIQKADKIIVLHKGEIKEIGNHQELLEKGGLYYDLYTLQYEERDANGDTTS